MKLVLILTIVLTVSISYAEIITAEYMSINSDNDDQLLLVRIEPNDDLFIPAVIAKYNKADLKKNISARAGLKNGIDMKIPKMIDGFKLTEMYFKVDQTSNYGGEVHGMLGLVSMWAGHLPVKLVQKSEPQEQVIYYQSETIGFHGTYPSFAFSKATRQKVYIALEGITTLKFNSIELCIDCK